MSMENNKLKEFIDEIIQEIEKDLDEATTSGAAGAYSTPGAFSDNGTKDKNKKKKIATQLGMKLVGKVNEATFKPNSGTMSGGTYNLDNSKYKLNRDVKGVRIGDYVGVTLPKGTIIYNIPGGVFADHKSLKKYADRNRIYFNKPTFKGISITREKSTLNSIEKNSKILESVVNEALTPIPHFKGHNNVTYIKLRTLFSEIDHLYFKTIDKVELGDTFIKVHYTMGNAGKATFKTGVGIPIEDSERGAVVKFLSKILKQKYGFKGNFKKVNYKESVVKEASDDVNFVVLYKNKGEKNTITRMRTTNTKAGGIKFLKDIEKKGGDGFVVKKADAVKLRLTTKKEWDVAKRKLGLKESESVNEAKKPQRPVNRWLAIKNDDTKHPHKKMAMGLKELKYQLAETQKFFNWYNQIKSMNELDSSDYWKRTNKHIYKIKERLINIAKTIQEIEK